MKTNLILWKFFINQSSTASKLLKTIITQFGAFLTVKMTNKLQDKDKGFVERKQNDFHKIKL